jgi:endonuclease/exonuclease/phosphatase family metal-dependent hydrolase
MDHVLYSPEFDCAAARVIPAGASDHFPVEAVLTRAR